MKVQKSNGALQDFDIEKIKLVIARVSDECEESMNTSDISNVAKSIGQALEAENEEVIAHTAVRNTVYNTLQEYGFTDVAEAYMHGKAK